MLRRTSATAFAAALTLTSVLTACSSSSSTSSASPTTSASSSAAAAGHPGGTFTILANSSFGVADPAQNYTLQEWQLLIDTHDGLTSFAKVGGVAGTKIVPDLATALPTPTNGGKTYVFHIRKGIKFSNGQVLKPSDFVTTFERQFTVPGPTSFYSDIVGASKCSTKGCDLSQGVVANDSAYTLTINLTAPDAELMDQLALPFAFVVPSSTSLKLTGNNVPPGTVNWRSNVLTKSLGLSTWPLENLIPWRMLNTYVLPPLVGSGIEVARSGTILASAVPPCLANPTRPSWVSISSCHSSSV